MFRNESPLMRSRRSVLAIIVAAVVLIHFPHFWLWHTLQMTPTGWKAGVLVSILICNFLEKRHFTG